MNAHEQCRGVAILVGLKTIVNEFTAYDRLGEFARAGILSKRSLTLNFFL
jgi:nucleoside permease NupC